LARCSQALTGSQTAVCRFVATICLLICGVISAKKKHRNMLADRPASGEADYGGEPRIMDTNSFDKKSKQHLKIYENFMFAAKISIMAIIVTLVIMAATLV
jgi:hypothetical protein